MEMNFSYLNESKSDICFMINNGTIILNFHNENNNNNIFSKKNYKGYLPKNKIFKINSLIFNEEKQCQELNHKYDCIYNETDNILYLIINERDNYLSFTKDKLINILEFSISIGIEKICLLISKTNKKYINIIQDMTLVGFKPEETSNKIKIDKNEYKILKMPIKDICQEIKEITLI